MKSYKLEVIGFVLTAITVYGILYFFVVFSKFEFFNPFQWVLNLEKYSESQRSSIIMLIILTTAIIVGIYNFLTKEIIRSYRFNKK